MMRLQFRPPYRSINRRRHSPVARLGAMAATLVLLVCSPAAADNPITQWNEFLVRLNSTVIPPATGTLRPPNVAAVHLAYVHIVMYDAVMAIVIKEAIDARIYNGVHYRTAVVHGVVLARKVSQWVGKYFFRPVE